MRCIDDAEELDRDEQSKIGVVANDALTVDGRKRPVVRRATLRAARVGVGATGGEWGVQDLGACEVLAAELGRPADREGYRERSGE